MCSQLKQRYQINSHVPQGLSYPILELVDSLPTVTFDTVVYANINFTVSPISNKLITIFDLIFNKC